MKKGKAHYRYLFGPVPSRRMGKSLGVDLVTPKTCSFDCLFCQVGKTTNRTLKRREYVPIREVIEELQDWLQRGGSADYITLAGSGEPTLHSHFDEVLDIVRARSDIRSALLSNGSLFFLPEVRLGARKSDLVKLSLSAWDAASLGIVNRPTVGVEFERLVGGMERFRDEFDGELWLEVMMMAGINSSEENVRRIADIAKRIRPDRVHLNTVVRPPADADAVAVPAPDLETLTGLFTPQAEVIANCALTQGARARADDAQIIALIRRRPCTEKDIALGLGIESSAVEEAVGVLVAMGRVRKEKRGDEVYYSCP